MGRWCANKLAFLAALVFVVAPVSAMPGHHHHGHGAKNPMKAKYDAVRRTLAEANRVLTAQDFDRALAMFEKGLADLGTDYATAKTIDDTGMKLILANAEAAKGKPAVAANLKKRVLEARLEMYRQTHLRH